MRRLILFVGRGGTVLITMGLALLLVSLIPSAQLATSSGKTAVPPGWVLPTLEQVLTPQQGLHVKIIANGTVDVYILEVSSLVLLKMASNDFLNVTNLEEFLEENPELIGWHNKIQNGEVEHEYVSTKVTNTTLVFSNPSLEYVPVEYEISLTSQVAPGTKVRNLSLFAIPIGFLLTLSWIVRAWKEKATLHT